jgi:hypothetical protein
MSAEITKNGALDMQVCIPSRWTNKQIVDFANRSNLCGTAGGWHIRKNGDPLLNGDPERQPCLQRKGHVHVMLDA